MKKQSKKSKKLPSPPPALTLEQRFPAFLTNAAKHFPIEQLAKEFGVSSRSVRLWKSGKGNINKATMIGCITLLEALAETIPSARAEMIAAMRKGENYRDTGGAKND